MKNPIIHFSIPKKEHLPTPFFNVKQKTPEGLWENRPSAPAPGLHFLKAEAELVHRAPGGIADWDKTKVTSECRPDSKLLGIESWEMEKFRMEFIN